jgi:antirestriction protein ArdC
VSQKDHLPQQNRSPREDVYSRVTARIVADLEAGTRPWMKPWSTTHTAGRITRPLRSNGTPYRGMNVLLLWSEALAKGYTAPTWMTYRQASKLGAQVRKGEQGSLVVYANQITRSETDDQGEEHEHSISFMKGYTVFNVAQIEGLPGSYHSLAADPLSPPARIAVAERFAAATAADIRHGGDRAFYAPPHDFVQMPPFEAFPEAERYYGVLLHELTHWTGHSSRLDRHFDDGRRFGSAGYAFEELIAELGAAFVCADLGVTPEVREDHAAYLASWLEVLKQDKRAIFTAASQAQRAADHLIGLQPSYDAMGDSGLPVPMAQAVAATR